MKAKVDELPNTGVWMTPHQFFLIMQGQKCSHCDKKAKWLPVEENMGPSYCDEHYPYWEYRNEVNG